MKKIQISIFVICLLFINNIKTEETTKIEKTKENITKDVENKEASIGKEIDSNDPSQKAESTDEIKVEEKVVVEPKIENKEEIVKKEEPKITEEKEVNSSNVENIEETPSVNENKEKIQKIDEEKIVVEKPIEKKEEVIEEKKVEEEKIVEEKIKEEEIVAPIATNNTFDGTTTNKEVITKVEEVDNKSTSWKTLIMFIISVVFISGLLILVFLSIYYRIYMFRKRTAPFEVPGILSALFPKPINYEHEITILCSKYMNN